MAWYPGTAGQGGAGLALRPALRASARPSFPACLFHHKPVLLPNLHQCFVFSGIYVLGLVFSKVLVLVLGNVFFI